MKTCTVIVLNYNGKQLLATHLPAVIKSASSCDVAVADNGSTDGSVDLLRKRFPSVKLFQFNKNYGFGEGNNRAVQAIKSQVVILFNNDIAPTPAAVRVLLGHFKDPNVFAVACRQVVKTKDGQFSGGSAIAEFSRGLLRHRPNPLSQNHAVAALFASGGAAAFDRQKFLTLGGFDSLYKPFYWEDTDLSARAWGRGWQVLHDPASVVEHRHETTIKKVYPAWYVKAIAGRNMFIYNWRHLNGLSFWLRHLAWLPVQIIRRSVGFLMALVKIPAIITRRLKDPYSMQIRDILLQ